MGLKPCLTGIYCFMGRKDWMRKNRYWIAAILLAAVALRLFLQPQREQDKKEDFFAAFVGQLQQAALTLWCPAVCFADRTQGYSLKQELLGQFPVLAFYGNSREIRLESESRDTYEEIIRAEGQDEIQNHLSPEELKTPEHSEGRTEVAEKEAEEKAEQLLPEAPVGGKAEEYNWDYYRKFDALVKEFYAVDSQTAVGEEQLNLKALLGRELSIEKRTDGKPQILIYHTHSQEGFANSVPGDPSTTIMGVGEVLTRILEDEYGYEVLHHMGQYDVEDRDYAYNNSLPALEQLLKDNPTIEVVIDLHRDQMPEEKKLVTEIEGRPTAKFMFFNGLSRTRRHGDIDYLPNENIADNLAFSFQMQALCNEYYPGLTRRIYLKGYRYNMHLKPRYLLVEMGAQNNTYQECYNACIPLARMLDMELSGADFTY